MTRSAAYDRLARVRDELEAARFSLSVVVRSWHDYLAQAPSPGGRNLSLGDVRRCLENLEVTYILRLFATFEALLRDYWLVGLGRTTEPELRQLMDSVAARRAMDSATLATAHDVRDFRNKIMHRNVRALRLDFVQCAKALGTYVSWLPQQW